MAGLKEVMAFFEMDAKSFTREWKKLNEKDREELRRGIGDGSLTY